MRSMIHVEDPPNCFKPNPPPWSLPPAHLEREDERERRERGPQSAALRGRQPQHCQPLGGRQAARARVPQQRAEQQVPLLLVVRLAQ